MNRSLILGSRGLARPDWLAGFYPPDLPEDWRLPYYANEFRALLLPAADWVGLDAAAAADWAGAMPEGFRCMLEFDASASWSSTALPTVLGERLAGLLCRDVPPTGVPPYVPCLRLVERRSALDLWRTPDGSLAVGIIAGQSSRPTPLELRHAIETLVEAGGGMPSGLFVDGPPGMLRDVQTLAGLLGCEVWPGG